MNKKLVIALLCCLVVPAKAGCLQRGTFETIRVIANNWLMNNCAIPDWCGAVDINLDKKVDLKDYSIYADSKPTVLVSNGVCNVSIHNLVSGTSSVETYAAKQLQAAFTLATGVTPAINPATPAAVRINIGVKNRFSVGLTDTSEQAYTIRTAYNGNIELVGNRPSAVLWAVDDFCDRVLGVSWPVANGAAVLRGAVRSNLSTEPLCVEQSPDFSVRGWWVGDHSPEGTYYNENIVSWMGHNRASIKTTPVDAMMPAGDTTYVRMVERGLDPDAGAAHNFWWLVNTNTYFATHPEYFPLINGVRVPGSLDGIGSQLCISNPDVFNIVVRKVVDSLDLYPNLHVFGIVPNDGHGGWCQCTNCASWDGDLAGQNIYTNRLIKFCNKVADYLHDSYPDLKIGTLAYSDFVVAPTINVSDNVLIYYCSAGRNLMRKLTDASDSSNAVIMSRINGWLAKANNVALYEYYYTTGLESTWLPFSRTLAQEFPELKALGIKGLTVETTKARWPNYIANVAYTFARSTWDTNLTYDQILTDYCDKRYGAASADMYSFYRIYEDSIYAGVPVLKMFGPAEQLYPPCFTATSLASMENHLSSAETIAQSGGNAQNIAALSEDRTRFSKFKRLSNDPANIPGIGSNLVVNPGIEEGWTGWFNDIQSGTYSFSVNSGNAHSGSKSMKIECTGTPGHSRIVQLNSSPVVKGRKYTARFWIKVTGSGAWGEIWLYQGVNDGKLAFVDTGGQWQMIVAPEVIADGDNSIQIYVNSMGPGTVEFDDCFLAELPAGY